MNGLYTIILLILSNVFMTLAWYGHLKLQSSGISANWPVIGIILFSWGIAFFEYCCQVPANRIGFQGNGGPFNLIQLKVIQECISLCVFAVIANIFIPRTVFTLESCVGILADNLCSISCFYEVNITSCHKFKFYASIIS